MPSQKRFDKDRFAYELAQELGIDYARVPAERAPGEALSEVQSEIQSTMEYGPSRRGARAGREPGDVSEPLDADGGAAGLSAVNRARATPTRSTLEANPTRAAQRDAEDALDDWDFEDGDESW